MKTRTLVAGVIILLLVISLLCCLGPRFTIQLWHIGIERAADRVNREPTTDGLADYITSEVQLGMSRAEIEKIFQAMAPTNVTLLHPLTDKNGFGYGPISGDKIRVKITWVPWHTLVFYARYNPQGELVMLRCAAPESFPALGISAPREFPGSQFSDFPD